MTVVCSSLRYFTLIKDHLRFYIYFKIKTSNVTFLAFFYQHRLSMDFCVSMETLIHVAFWYATWNSKCKINPTYMTVVCFVLDFILDYPWAGVCFSRSLHTVDTLELFSFLYIFISCLQCFLLFFYDYRFMYY